jgi:hypothetical protein
MHVVEQHEGGGGDGADAPGAEADPAQRLEGGLEQRVAALGRGAGGRVQQVDGALVGGQSVAGGGLERRGQRRPLALIAQVGQDGVLRVGPLGQQWQRLRVQGRGKVRIGALSCGDPDRCPLPASAGPSVGQTCRRNVLLLPRSERPGDSFADETTALGTVHADSWR